MAHLDEGALQAYLDGEIEGRGRAEAAEHLLACAECRGHLDALKRANERLGHALAALDVRPPAAAPRRALSERKRRGFGGGSVIRAAVLVLVVAAAASASVPGSPVREWIAQVVRPDDPAPAASSADVPPEDSVATPAAPGAPAGIAVPGLREMDVVVTGLEGATIRLVRVAEAGVSVSARGGERDPRFRLASGRIEVVGGAGGELLIEVPQAGATMRLMVNGRRYAELVQGDLRVLVPGVRDGSAVVWR